MSPESPAVRRPLSGAAWALLHQGLGRGGVFLFFAWLPRLLPLDALGRYMLAYTALLLALQPLFGSALPMLLVKALARGERAQAGRALRAGRALLLLALPLAGLLAVLAGVPARLAAALALVVGLQASLDVAFAALRGRGRFAAEACCGLLAKLALWPASLALHGAGLEGDLLPAAAQLAGAALGWIAVLACAGGEMAATLQAGPGFPGAEQRREALLLAAGAALGLAHLRADLLLLGRYQGAAAAGLYATAFRWAEIGHAAANAGLLGLFPLLSARLAPDRPAADRRRLLARMALLAGALGLLAAAAVVLCARIALPLFYGGGAPPLEGLLWALLPTIPAVFLGGLGGQALVAADRADLGLRVATLALLVDLGVAWLAVPSLGPTGAALASVLSESCVAAASLGLAFRHLRAR